MYASCVKFSSTPDTSVEQVHQIPFSKSTLPYSVAPFFQEYLNPQIWINKMANKVSITALVLQNEHQ